MRAAQWRARVAYLLHSDPDGGFVALREGRVIGMAQAMLRDGLWCLSLLTVVPAAQGSGAGRALIDATLSYAAERRRGGVIVASDDPRALTLYARTGFALRPTVEATGTARALPAPDPRVRRLIGTAAELAALAPVCRTVRGAAGTEEIRFALEVRGARLLALEDQGLAVVIDGQGVWLLVAHDEASARALLLAALAELRGWPESPVRWLTAEQGWAISLLVELGLHVRGYGAVCVQGEVGTLMPYVPSPAFA